MARIFTNRKSGFIQRSGKMRRESLWVGMGDSTATLAASGQAGLMNTLSAVGLALLPFTVVRTLWEVLVTSDQSVASEFYRAKTGFCVVSEQATAIGITAVPTPATDNNSDLWYAYSQSIGEFDFASAVGFTEGNRSRSYESRAMRKVEEGQDVAYVVEAGLTDQGCIIRTSGRWLIKLH